MIYCLPAFFQLNVEFWIQVFFKSSHSAKIWVVKSKVFAVVRRQVPGGFWGILYGGGGLIMQF